MQLDGGVTEQMNGRPQQTTAYVAFGVMLFIAGAFMTGGSLGPFVGLIVAMLGVGLVVVGLIRRR